MGFCPECIQANRSFTVNYTDKVYLSLDEGDGKGYPYCEQCGLVLNKEAAVTRRLAIFYIRQHQFIQSIESDLIQKIKKRQISPFDAMQAAEYWLRQPNAILTPK